MSAEGPTSLVCPMTRAPLCYDADAQDLVSEAPGPAYPVPDGAPVQPVEKARTSAG